MRRVVIGGVVLLLVLVAVVAVAARNVNGYLADNRETLEGLASDAAGRDVKFERAEVAFSSGLAVRVVGLRVAEDARFGTGDFLSLDDAFVGVRIWPALKRRIEVSDIRLGAPMIRVIQTAAGFNFASIADAVAGESAPPSGGKPQGTDSAPGGGDAEDAAQLAVAIAAVEIEGGTLVFEDRRSPDGLSIVVSDLTTSGTDLALDGPIALDFSGHVRSQKPEDAGLASHVEGDVRLSGLDPVQGVVNLRSPRLHPALFGLRLEEGKTAERLDTLTVALDLAPDPSKTGFPIRLRSKGSRLSGLDIEAIAVDAVYRDTKAGAKIDLSQAVVDLFGGRIDVSGNVLLGKPDASPFELTTKVTNVQAGRLAERLLDLSADAVSGTLGGDITLSGKSLEWERLKRNLAGQLDLQVGDGALEQVNVLGRVVRRMAVDPGFGMLAANAIRDVAPEALAKERTPFDRIDMALEVRDGAVHARNLDIDAGDFALSALGRVGFDGAVAAKGKILLSQKLSKKLLDKADELEPLLVADERMALPLRFGGTAGSPTVMADLSGLSEEAKQELTNRAAKELSDAIFGKRKNREDGPADAREADDRDAAESLIKEGLGRLLR